MEKGHLTSLLLELCEAIHTLFPWFAFHPLIQANQVLSRFSLSPKGMMLAWTTSVSEKLDRNAERCA